MPKGSHSVGCSSHTSSSYTSAQGIAPYWTLGALLPLYTSASLGTELNPGAGIAKSRRATQRGQKGINSIKGAQITSPRLTATGDREGFHPQRVPWEYLRHREMGQLHLWSNSQHHPSVKQQLLVKTPLAKQDPSNLPLQGPTTPHRLQLIIPSRISTSLSPPLVISSIKVIELSLKQLGVAKQAQRQEASMLRAKLGLRVNNLWPSLKNSLGKGCKSQSQACLLL